MALSDAAAVADVAAVVAVVADGVIDVGIDFGFVVVFDALDGAVDVVADAFAGVVDAAVIAVAEFLNCPGQYANRGIFCLSFIFPLAHLTTPLHLPRCFCSCCFSPFLLIWIVESIVAKIIAVVVIVTVDDVFIGSK